MPIFPGCLLKLFVSNYVVNNWTLHLEHSPFGSIYVAVVVIPDHPTGPDLREGLCQTMLLVTNRVRPVELVSINLPVPGADAGEVLAAFEAFGVAFLVDALSLGEAVDQRTALGQLLLQRTIAPDQRDNQGNGQRADGSAGPDGIHSGIAIMVNRTVGGGGGYISSQPLPDTERNGCQLPAFLGKRRP